MTRNCFFCLLLVLSISAPIRANSLDEKLILGLLQQFMEGIAEQNKEKILSVFATEEATFASPIPRNKELFSHIDTAAGFADLVLSQKQRPSEEFNNVHITVQDTIAIASFDYAFKLDGKTMNFGKETWLLMLTPSGWRGTAVSWTTNLPKVGQQ